MFRKVALAAVLLAAVAAVRAADTTPAGTWKIALPVRGGNQQLFWLIKLGEVDGKWDGEVVATAEGLPKTSLEGLAVAKDLITFRLVIKGEKVPFEMRPTDGDVMFGSAKLGGRIQPLKFERTAVTTLDAYELDKEKVAKAPIDPDTVRLALDLLGGAEAKKAKLLEARSWAEKAVKTADAFGPAFRRDVLLDVADILAKQEGFAAVAVPYARQAERLLDPAKDRPGVQRNQVRAARDDRRMGLAGSGSKFPPPRLRLPRPPAP